LICRLYSRSSGLLFRKDIVTTFSGETVRKLRVASLFALGILVWAVLFAGCSGSNSLTVTLTPASGQTLNPGQAVTIVAAVANDTNNQGVSWSLSGPGLLSSNTTTSVVYTAPSSVSTATTATITATSIANTSITATESVTLNAVLTITTTSLPAGTLNVPYNAFINAAGATGTFTWTVTKGGLPAGLTFLTTSTSSSAEITGTPTLLQTSNFTVQVTDSSGSTVTQALSITINRPPPLSVATGSLPSGTVDTAYSQTLQASSGVPPYTWSVPPGTLPVGLNLASNGVISGKPLATGTSYFTVQVTDSSTPTPQIATANLSITINPGLTNNSILSGNYAFSVSGFNSNGPQLPLFVAAGSFVADGNGNISAGIMDINNTASGPVNPTFSGTYSIGQNGLGFMTLNIAPPGSGSRTFALSVMANGNANIIEFDDSTGGFANNSARNSGVLLKQDTSAFSTAFSTGGYAFGFLGIDSGKNRFGVAGDFQSDGAGNFTSGLLDSDDASSGPSPAVAFSGTYTAVASSGRGQATIKTAQATTVYSFYVVSSGQLLVVGVDPFVLGGNPLVSGTILGQASNSGFSGTPSVFEVTGLDQAGPSSESQVGLFAAVTNTYNLTSDQNTNGTVTPLIGSGGYSIANGRVTLAGSGFQNSQPVLYMVSDNQAFIIGTDPAVSFGFMTPQSPFSLSGTYAGGSLAAADPAVSNVVSIAVAGSNNFTATADVSNENGLSQTQVSEDTTPPDHNGRVVVTENGNPTEILYLISGAQFVALSTDKTARVDIFQQ
jgi:hypothetical protein